MKGLENAIRNLNSLDTRMVPQASAWAINRVAQKAVSVATRQVAGNTVAGDNQVKGIPLKLVRQRVRVFKASPSGKMTARIRVNRGNLPAIKLGTARVRLARRGGKLQYRGSVLKVGKYLFRDAFIQQLANGRWHVMRRIDGKNRYLDFFKGEIGKTHLAQELWTQIDNGQLAPDLAEIRTSITDVSNEITQTVNKKLEDQSAAIQQIQKVQVDTNNNLNSMWAVKLQQMQDGRLYIAGIGAGIENTPDGMQSQVLLAADRIAMINPANGNTKPMFVGQGDQIFMNEVFLKYLTAPTITSGGNPPAFSLTPDGKLTAKNADISGSVNANSGTLNNVTINENCQIKGKLSANQIEGDIVKTVGKAFPRDSRAPERWPSGTITVRIYDDQPFDRQIVIPAVAFSGAKHEREHTDIYSSCRLIVKKNGAEIYNRTALDNTLIYSGVIDMPAGHGHMTLEFSVSAWLVNDWYPTASISDLLVVVMKKATAGISIS